MSRKNTKLSHTYMLLSPFFKYGSIHFFTIGQIQFMNLVIVFKSYFLSIVKAAKDSRGMKGATAVLFQSFAEAKWRPNTSLLPTNAAAESRQLAPSALTPSE